jgi:hypothetical protein
VKPLPRWPLAVIAAPAAVATWSGWTGLGELCGFGTVHPLPGIWDAATVNTAITLPVGVEAYATYALAAWLRPGTPPNARRFARWSALGSLILGAAGQVSYHLLSARHAIAAPWPVVMIVSCLPVAVLGLAGGLSHLLGTDTPDAEMDAPDIAPDVPVDIATDNTTDGPDVPVDTADTVTDIGDNSPRTRDRVAAMRAARPDMSVTDIAAELGVTDRTVRRHLATLAQRAA